MTRGMWQDKIDVSKLNEDVTLDYKIKSPGYVKTKVRKSKEIYNKEYRLNAGNKKNSKLYIFLILDNKENINLMQQFEIDYLKSKAKDMESALELIQSGITEKIIERQMNVKISFIRWVTDNGITTFLRNFKGKEVEYKHKIKKGSRVVETDKLLTEYINNKLDIIGYIRDGNTVSHTLDNVGSIYSTREWTSFMAILEEEGYDLRGSDKLEDIILMKLDGSTEEEIEVELGFNGTLEEESKVIFKSMDFKLDLQSIGDDVVREYQDYRDKIDFESKEKEMPETIEGVIHNIENYKGLELLEFLDSYVYYNDDLNELFREGREFNKDFKV